MYPKNSDGKSEQTVPIQIKHYITCITRLGHIHPFFFSWCHLKQIFANSVDPDHTSQNAASGQGLHCMKYRNFYKRAKMALYRSPEYEKCFESIGLSVQNIFSRLQLWKPSLISDQNELSYF